jgi:hypothetical protein
MTCGFRYVNVEILAVKSSSHGLSQHQPFSTCKDIMSESLQECRGDSRSRRVVEMFIVQYFSKVYTKTHAQQPWTTELQ